LPKEVFPVTLRRSTFLASAAAAAAISTRPRTARAASLGSVQFFSGADPAAFGAIFLADKTGLFTANGVDVTIALFPSGTTATEAFLANGSGFVAAGDLPSMLLWQRSGGDVTGVLPLMSDDVSFSIVAGADVKTPADLKGKKIATRLGSTGNIYVSNYLKAHNLTGQVEVINLDADSMMPAMARNDIAAFCWSGITPAATISSVPGAHYLNRGSKGYVTNHCAVSAFQKTLTDQPAISKAVIAAIIRGTEMIASDPQKASVVLGTSFKMDPAKVLGTLDGIHYSAVDDSTWRNGWTDMSKTAVEIGVMKAPADMNKSWNTKVAASIKKSLVS
jgi:ABC-type nitrate/sulfonate/bicarbonate transport system substrate-binding protein